MEIISANSKRTLLVTDMDGTLLNSKHAISKENLAAIERFVARGGLFTLATGRTDSSVRPYLDKLPVNVPAILYNGGMIYDCARHRVIWEQFLPDDAKRIVWPVLDDFTETGIEVYDSAGDVYILAGNDLTDYHMLRENLNPKRLGVEAALQARAWRKILFAWDQNCMPLLERFLNHLIRQQGWSIRTMRTEANFLEIVPSDVNKGAALMQVSQSLGVERSNVMAVGDNLNDLEMLKIAGVGVAVANAHLSVKRTADFCTVSNDEHAVAEMIEWIERSGMNYKHSVPPFRGRFMDAKSLFARSQTEIGKAYKVSE